MRQCLDQIHDKRILHNIESIRLLFGILMNYFENTIVLVDNDAENYENLV